MSISTRWVKFVKSDPATNYEQHMHITYIYLFWQLSMLKFTKYWPLSLNNIWIGDILWIISGCCRDIVAMFTGLLVDVISVKSGNDCIWLDVLGAPVIWLVKGCKLELWLVKGCKLWLWLMILISPERKQISWSRI